MTIEEYAAAQELPDITKHVINGVPVYRLENKRDAGKAVGLPFFALHKGDSFIQADAKETFRIMDYLYGNDE